MECYESKRTDEWTGLDMTMQTQINNQFKRILNDKNGKTNERPTRILKNTKFLIIRSIMGALGMKFGN